MSSDHRLLRKYIRESLVSEKFGDGAGNFIKGNLGLASGKSGPQKWFAQFMGKQLDTAGERIDKWVGGVLDGLLPSELKTKISSYQKETGESASTSLTKVVQGWISDIEDMSDREFDKTQKKQIYEYASKEYAALLKKDSDVQKALLMVKRKLDMKYGNSLKDKKSKHQSDAKDLSKKDK